MFHRKSKINKLDKFYIAQSGIDVITTQPTGLVSQKPFELYEIIERMVPQGPYLELFARVVNWREDWVSAGNEALEFLQSTKKIKKQINVTQ